MFVSNIVPVDTWSTSRGHHGMKMFPYYWALCVANLLVTCGFTSQRTSYAWMLAFVVSPSKLSQNSQVADDLRCLKFKYPCDFPAEKYWHSTPSDWRAGATLSWVASWRFRKRAFYENASDFPSQYHERWWGFFCCLSKLAQTNSVICLPRWVPITQLLSVWYFTREQWIPTVYVN